VFKEDVGEELVRRGNIKRLKTRLGEKRDRFFKKPGRGGLHRPNTYKKKGHRQDPVETPPTPRKRESVVW